MTFGIADIYRSTEVMRWHIVKTKRKQSVAEHSYIVAVLCHELAALLGPTIDREAMVTGALFHDTAECLYGDIPSPIKGMMDVDTLIAIEQKYCRRYANYEHELGPREKQLLKIADLAEAVKFLLVNKDSGHASKVLSKLIAVMNDKIASFDLEFMEATGRGKIYKEVIHPFLYGAEFTIDDIS